MHRGLELEQVTPELTIPLRWPLPFRELERIWRNVSGQQRAYRAGVNVGIVLAARTAAHEIGNAISPALAYADLLSLNPAIQRGEPGVRIDLQNIMISILDASRRLTLLGNLRRIVLSPLSGPPMLDLEASARPPEE